MVSKQPVIPASRRDVVFKWVSLVARLVIGGAIMIAGLLKIGNLQSSVNAVAAYSLPLLPTGGSLTTVVGTVMPIVEIVLGAIIVAGLFSRWTALLGGLMMIVYICLISSAWIRGLSIDCGCFSPGGFLPDTAKTKYLQDILRDVGLLICAAWVVIWPKSPISIDNWIDSANKEEA